LTAGLPAIEGLPGEDGVAFTWFRRRNSRVGAGGRGGNSADLEHLTEFARSRVGVEGYLEPRTTVTQTTLILIAHDGEWTRRRVADPQAARRFCAKLNLPVYEVNLVGYPQRMRDYNRRQRGS
jgi:hypothetical protein